MESKLKCPHGRTVTVDKAFGIIVYRHTSGKQCGLMARFKTKISEISEEQVTHANTARAQFALCTTKAFIYETIDNLQSAKSEDELTEMLTGLNQKGFLLYIVKPLAKAFGRVFHTNMLELRKSRQWVNENVIKEAQEVTDGRKKPKYTMISLEARGLRDAAEALRIKAAMKHGDIEDALNEILDTKKEKDVEFDLDF